MYKGLIVKATLNRGCFCCLKFLNPRLFLESVAIGPRRSGHGPDRSLPSHRDASKPYVGFLVWGFRGGGGPGFFLKGLAKVGFWKVVLGPVVRRPVVSGPLVPRCFGLLVLWSRGPLVPWSSGPVVLWSPGSLVPWSSGPAVLWSLHLLVPWSLVCRF